MKKKWLLPVIFTMSAAMLFSACNPGDTSGSGSDTAGGSKDDVYQDYDPNKQPGGNQFDYEGNYQDPELKMDGKGDDEEWKSAKVLTTFGKTVNGKDAVTAKIYRGNSALFFLFDVVDTILLTDGETNDSKVVNGDCVEIYLDTLADGGNNPQSDDYQINLGIHGKTRILQGSGSGWGNWNGLIDYEVDLKGTLNNGTAANDTGYTVEVMIPYSQIMIEKNDTIGISFGHVDKWGEGRASGVDWQWYGWKWGEGDNYYLREPQTINNYVLLDKDNNLIDRDDEVRPAADMAAYVTDSKGNPVVGATATTTIGGKEVSVATGSDGYFVFEDVDPEQSYTVLITANGYIGGQIFYVREELRAANGGRVLKDVQLLSLEGLETTTLTGTVKNVVEGAIGGATITVKNTTIATTASADGTFTLEDVPANNGDITIVVSKEGYGDSEALISEAELEANGTVSLNDVNINLPWLNLGTFAAKSPSFINASAKLTRELGGIRILFDGAYRLSGRIEVYLDTKENTTNRENDSTAWCLNLNDNGIVTGVHYQNSFTAAGLEWVIEQNDSEGFAGSLFIPYSYLDIKPTEVFGIELGQWSTSANDWDGWSSPSNGLNTPKAEDPTQWHRVGARNNLYKATNNDTNVTLSGNVGQGGVTVSVGTRTTTSDGEGNWTFNVPLTEQDITITYSKTGYITSTETVPADHFSAMVTTWESDGVTLGVYYVSVAGKVTDQNGDPVSDAEVTILDGAALNMTVRTNDAGEYIIDKVTAFANATITFELDGYATGVSTLTTTQLFAAENGQITVDKSLTELSQIKQITITGKVTDIEGALAGATVTVDGTDISVTTDAEGNFTISEFDSVDSIFTIKKDGYLSATIIYNAEELGNETTYVIADVFLAREYEAFGGAFGVTDNSFAHFIPYVTRGENAFEFRFVGSHAFTGTIELFVDTKISSGDGGRNATDYRFDLRADGTIGINNWGGTNTNTATLTLKVEGATTETPIVTFSLPYAFLGVAKTEIVGVTFGQSNGTSWNGWDNESMKGVNGIAFVQPERTWDYIRIGVDNKPFWNAENKTLEQLDLTSYNLHFGKGAADDSFHGKVVSRDSEGITFEFVTLGDFGSRGGKLETVLLYFDKGAVVGGWSGVDYQFKFVSDGNVYGGPQAWYAADQAHKLGTYTITRENGITKFTYKVLYSTIGATAEEVLGFTVIEGWLTGNNGSNEYANGLLYTHETGNHVVGDAANTAHYVRIKADGTLTTATSNADVQ